MDDGREWGTIYICLEICVQGSFGTHTVLFELLSLRVQDLELCRFNAEFTETLNPKPSIVASIFFSIIPRQPLYNPNETNIYPLYNPNKTPIEPLYMAVCRGT